MSGASGRDSGSPLELSLTASGFGDGLAGAFSEVASGLRDLEARNSLKLDHEPVASSFASG
jgi:hypothetical protein